jgi:hypothetical protein
MHALYRATTTTRKLAAVKLLVGLAALLASTAMLLLVDGGTATAKAAVQRCQWNPATRYRLAREQDVTVEHQTCVIDFGNGLAKAWVYTRGIRPAGGASITASTSTRSLRFSKGVLVARLGPACLEASRASSPSGLTPRRAGNTRASSRHSGLCAGGCCGLAGSSTLTSTVTARWASSTGCSDPRKCHPQGD